VDGIATDSIRLSFLAISQRNKANKFNTHDECRLSHTRVSEILGQISRAAVLNWYCRAQDSGVFKPQLTVGMESHELSGGFLAASLEI